MPDQTPDPRLESGFRLGEWTARPAQNRLVSPKRTRHLEPRAMDLLCALAARQGRVVDKDTLIDDVWEGRIISEGTLSNTVAELRQALEDDARSPRFIETIPKRGYRLLVAVEPVSPSPSDDRRWRPGPRLALAAAAAAAAVVVALVLRSREEPPRPAAVDLLPTVRVEQLVDRTDSPELATVAPMATDWIVKGLVDTGLVRVVRGREAGAASLVISGACYTRDDLCACRAEVARRDGTLLAALEPRPAPAPSAVVEEIRQAVAGAVAAHLGSHAHSRLLLSRPPRLDAWREFAAGSMLFGGDTAAALHHLERAVELDPEFFSARLRLAFVQRQLGRTSQALATLGALDAERDRCTPFERLWLDAAKAVFARRFEEARAHYARLQETLPDDPTLNHLAGAAALALNRPADGLRDYQRIDLHALAPEFRQAPIVAGIVRNHALALHHLGRDREGLAVVEMARSLLAPSPKLDAAEIVARAGLGDVAGIRTLLAAPLATAPDGPDRGELLLLAAATLRASGHRQASLGLAAESVTWWRVRAQDPAAPVELAESLAYAERWAEAEDLLRSQLAVRPGDPRLLGWLAVVAGRRGDRDAVLEIERQMASSQGPPGGGWPTFWRAVAAGEGGSGAHAAELLEQACREGWGWWSFLLDSMLLEPVRDAPEVREVLRPRG